MHFFAVVASMLFIPKSIGLTCYSCQFSYNEIYDAINLEDGFCTNATLLKMPTDEVIKACSSVDKYCSTVITTILNSFTSISRACAEHCSPVCESVGFGQNQVICTDCCQTNNCNNNYTVEYYGVLDSRQYTSWTRPLRSEIKYNKLTNAKFPY